MLVPALPIHTNGRESLKLFFLAAARLWTLYTSYHDGIPAVWDNSTC